MEGSAERCESELLTLGAAELDENDAALIRPVSILASASSLRPSTLPFQIWIQPMFSGSAVNSRCRAGVAGILRPERRPWAFLQGQSVNDPLAFLVVLPSVVRLVQGATSPAMAKIANQHVDPTDLPGFATEPFRVHFPSPMAARATPYR